jgi:hypothetical protein
MSRIRVYAARTDLDALTGSPVRPLGSFETHAAEWWEGDRQGGAVPRVWFTPSGQWAYTCGDIAEWLTADVARETLTRWGYGAEAAERIEREHAGRGRPEIGPEVKTRLPESAIAALDEMAGANGISRAEQMRRLILDNLWAE